MERIPIHHGPNERASRPLWLTQAHSVAGLTEARKTAGGELGAYDPLILDCLADWESGTAWHDTVLTVGPGLIRTHLT
jgi:hypothetical protein